MTYHAIITIKSYYYICEIIAITIAWNFISNMNTKKYEMLTWKNCSYHFYHCCWHSFFFSQFYCWYRMCKYTFKVSYMKISTYPEESEKHTNSKDLRPAVDLHNLIIITKHKISFSGHSTGRQHLENSKKLENLRQKRKWAWQIIKWDKQRETV